MTRLILISIVALLMIACERENKLCLKKAGTQGQLRQDLPIVSSLEINDEIDVEFVRDTTNFAIVKAGSNILPMISFEQDGDAVVIQNNSKCNWYRNYDKNKVIVEIHSSQIYNITINNGSNFTTPDTIHGGKLFMNFWESGGDCNLKINIDTLKLAMHTGPTTVNVAGQANMSYFYSAGDALIDAYNLHTINADIHHAGVNDYFIKCTGDVGIQLRSIGNIFLKGSPNLIYQTVTGTGNIIFE